MPMGLEFGRAPSSGAPSKRSPGTFALLAPAALAALAGCGPAAPPAPTVAAPSYRLASMRWLPPGEEIVYAYRTENLIERTAGVLSLRLRRTGDDSAGLISPQRTETLRYTEGGILRERTGNLLLRLPIEAGTRWPAGPGASAHIGRIGLPVTSEAGTFAGCLEVIEERSAPVAGTITTTFCPDVGIVRIETRAGEPPVHERVKLRSFGRPIDIATVR